MQKFDIKPFVKWAGGKRKLYGFLSQNFPQFSGKYIEPFLGGGAIFLSLQPIEAVVGDNNSKLIEVYEIVRDDVESLIILLNNFINTEEEYYKIRANVPPTKLERVARFLYLNKTCFNGLYRENSKGEFNVPYGKHKTLNFEVENIRLVSEYLHSTKIQLTTDDWKNLIAKATQGDFVFLDPPYYPVNETSFTQYSKDSISGTNLVEMVQEMQRLSKLGVYVMMTNSYCPAVLEAFKEFNIKEITSNWSVGAKSETRTKKITEVMITNY